LWWNVLFAFLNPAFSLLLGMFYGLLGLYWLSAQQPGGTVVSGAILYAGFAAYSYYMNQKQRALLTAFVHAVAQTTSLILLLQSARWLFEPVVGAYVASWSWWGIILLWTVPLGGIIAGTLFGVGMLINCFLFDMDHNDAFSAMRHNSYRHFLRLCIKDDQLAIYSIGFDNTPRRDQWIESAQVTEAKPSRVIPKVDLAQKLIDEPILIDAGSVLSVIEISQRKSATLAGAPPAASQPVAS